MSEQEFLSHYAANVTIRHPQLLCPECRQGKPWNCTGWVIDENDNEAPCANDIQ